MALASVVKVDIEAGLPGQKEGWMQGAEQLEKDQGITHNSQDANNIIFCHELLNINYGDTFAVSFNRKLWL